jgi:hypothetical protein
MEALATKCAPGNQPDASKLSITGDRTLHNHKVPWLSFPFPDREETGPLFGGIKRGRLTPFHGAPDRNSESTSTKDILLDGECALCNDFLVTIAGR